MRCCCVILRLAALVELRLVTDRRTDRLTQALGYYRGCIASRGKNEAITYHIGLLRLSVCEMVTCWRVVCVSCSTYVVVAPQIVRAGSTYDVIVTIFDADSVVNVDVSLRNARDVIIASSRSTVTAGQRSFTTYRLTALTWNTRKTHGILLTWNNPGILFRTWNFWRRPNKSIYIGFNFVKTVVRIN